MANTSTPVTTDATQACYQVMTRSSTKKRLAQSTDSILQSRTKRPFQIAKQSALQKKDIHDDLFDASESDSSATSKSCVPCINLMSSESQEKEGKEEPVHKPSQPPDAPTLADGNNEMANQKDDNEISGLDSPVHLPAEQDTSDEQVNGPIMEGNRGDHVSIGSSKTTIRPVKVPTSEPNLDAQYDMPSNQKVRN